MALPVGAPGAGVNELLNSIRPRHSPPWRRRGGRDINKNAAKPPLMERTGWLVQLPIIRGLNEPPRLRRLRRLRNI
jgi:hypothetical protein